VRASMPGMQNFASERKQWPLLIGTLGTLGIAAYVAVKLLSPSAPAPVVVTAVQPVATVPAQPTTIVGPVGSAATNTGPELAPYMQEAPREGPADSNAVFTPATTQSPVLPVAQTAVSAPVNNAPVYSAQQQAAIATALAPAAPDGSAGTNPEPATALAASAANPVVMTEPVAAPVAQEPARVKAAPVQRTPPDKSYLDKTTFKLGRQPDSTKDQDVSHWVNLFSSAMSAGNYEEARAHLTQLQAKLPAQSITSLRMQAWYAVDTSDDTTAREVFMRILDRVPDDQNAGVNIALIDWRANRFSAALARIDRLHQLYPDSSLVSQNWRSMHDQQQ